MTPSQILGPDDPALAALANRLEAQPAWQTRLAIKPWAKYQPAVEAALQANTSPYQAVCIPGHVWLPGLASQGRLAAFEPLVERLPEQARAAYDAGDLVPELAAETCFEGQTYLCPLFTDGHLLFFNKDRIDLEDGATVSPLDLAALAGRARLPAGTHALALKAHPSEILLDWLPFLWAAGGEVVEAGGAPGFAGPEGVEALEYYIALKRFCPGRPEGYDNAKIAAALRDGRVALATSWGGQAAPIFSGQARLGVALYPRPWNGAWGIALPANQPESAQLAMLERLYRICGPELDRQVTLQAGSPVRQSSYHTDECERYPWLRTQREMLRRAGRLPAHPRLGDMLGALAAAVSSAFGGQMAPRQALKIAEEKVIEVLNG